MDNTITDAGKIFYCRIGWMNSYRGNDTEKPIGGGKYNHDPNNVGHEAHNYLGIDGRYYGFVEAGQNKGNANSIHIEKLGADKNAEYVDNVLVIWVSRNPKTGGQFVVGWYENARVYRELQTVPDDAMELRTLKTHNFYNIYSEHVYLIDAQKRSCPVVGMGHTNIWYNENDDGETNKKIIEYITKYKKDYDYQIEEVNKNLDDLIGKERDALVKVRINQSKFREGLIKKYRCKCCLCGVDNENLLKASHIKPWAKSDEHEKLDLANGLLLCPNHDKLFDAGLISFEQNGNIMISKEMSDNNRIFMNVHSDMKINISADNIEYIRYHRENVYKDSTAN